MRLVEKVIACRMRQELGSAAMRHWLVLAAAYALVAALIVPGPLGAQEEAPDQASVPGEAVPAIRRPSSRFRLRRLRGARSGARRACARGAGTRAGRARPGRACAGSRRACAGARRAVRHVRRARGPPNKRRARKPTAVAAATTNVTIVDFEFTPASITIQQGDTVTWTGDGPTAHSATASDGSFDTASSRPVVAAPRPSTRPAPSPTSARLTRT